MPAESLTAAGFRILAGRHPENPGTHRYHRNAHLVEGCSTSHGLLEAKDPEAEASLEQSFLQNQHGKEMGRAVADGYDQRQG